MADQARVSEKRILLVDDDATARQSVKLLLMIDRHLVTEAADSTEALGLFARGRFDLAIIDYFMPQTPGNELAAAIRRIDAAQPIVMITAYAEKLVDSRLPVDAILAKPFGIEDLRQTIAQVIS